MVWLSDAACFCQTHLIRSRWWENEVRGSETSSWGYWRLLVFELNPVFQRTRSTLFHPYGLLDVKVHQMGVSGGFVGLVWLSAVRLNESSVVSVGSSCFLTSFHVFGPSSYFHCASSSITVFWPLDFSLAHYYWVDQRGDRAGSGWAGLGRARGLTVWMQNSDAISD